MLPATDRVLVLFPGALGDFLCALPAFVALHARHATLQLVAQPALLDLVRLAMLHTASIDRREVADLFAVRTPVAAETRALLGGASLVHSWTGCGVAAVVERLRAISPGDVYVHPFRGMRPHEPAVEYYARCVGLPPRPLAGVVREDGGWIADFRTRHGIEGDYVVVHAGSGAARKNWEGFPDLAERLQREAGLRLIGLSGPAEGGQPPLPGALPLTDLALPQVAALLRGSRLYVGNDSGISHLAGAVGAVGVVLFGPSDPAVWAPWGGTLRVLHAPQPCGRCGPDRFCMHRLPVEVVLEALRGLARGLALPRVAHTANLRNDR